MVGTLIEIYVGNKATTLTCQNGSTRIGILKEHATHFYPSQKIEASKVSYVREVRGKQTGTASATGMGYEMTSKTEWQPAPEPSEDDYQSAAGVKMEVSYEHLKKEHAQWTDDRSEGKVQAAIDQDK